MMIKKIMEILAVKQDIEADLKKDLEAFKLSVGNISISPAYAGDEESMKITPYHPERAQRLAALLSKKGWHVVKVSAEGGVIVKGKKEMKAVA
jgi:hypothetical protein